MDLLKRIFPVWGNRLAIRGMLRTMGMTSLAQQTVQQVEEDAQSSTAS